MSGKDLLTNHRWQDHTILLRSEIIALNPLRIAKYVLESLEKVRELQRKLYQKAKRGKGFWFYLLYDKVYRRKILSHAYEIVKTYGLSSDQAYKAKVFQRLHQNKTLLYANVARVLLQSDIMAPFICLFLCLHIGTPVLTQVHPGAAVGINATAGNFSWDADIP